MGQQSPLLELLDNAKILQGDRLDERRVLRLTPAQLTDLGRQAALVTKPEVVERLSGTLTHTATLSLGGGSEPCANLSCRVKHVDELAQFAAFYSDRVYIHNFLSNHASHPHSGYIPSIEERRFTLLTDLQVLQRLRPLIETGLIVPVTATGDVCNQCVALGAFGTGADKRFDRERKRLAARFFREMKVVIDYVDGEWTIECQAPDDLLEHGNSLTVYDEAPDTLRRMPRVMQRALDGEAVTLSRDARRKLGIHDDAAADIFGSVVFEMAVAQALGASYLSDTQLPIEVLAAISGDSDLARRNSLVQKHLTSLVPFAADLPLESVMKVRQREGEAFLTYRGALAKAIDDVRSRKADFNARDAQAIYSDILAPGLAKLDRAVKVARKDVVKETGRSVIGWSAAISFGMYTGLLPAQLLLAGKALGLTKVLSDVATGASKLLSPEDAVRKDDLFFLWKVRQVSKGRRRRPRRAT